MACTEATKIAEKNLVREFIDKDADAPVMPQRQEPMNQKGQKTVEVPRVVHIDGIVDVSVLQRQALMIQKTEEVSQVQFSDRAADVPVSMKRPCAARANPGAHC